MGGFSLWHWLIVGLVILLLFGKGRFSDMMGDVAKGPEELQEGHERGRGGRAKAPHDRAHGRGAAVPPAPTAAAEPVAPPAERGSASEPTATRPALHAGEQDVRNRFRRNPDHRDVALVVIGPKDLPRVMRTIGNFVGRARGMARHFRTGLDTMMRESELEEMEKKWKADNERIMREHPAIPGPAGDSDWGKPAPEASGPAPGGAPPARRRARCRAGAPPIPPAGATPPATGELP